MKWIICENYDDMCNQAGAYYTEFINAKPNAVLGFATGSTPVGLYQYLADRCSEGKADFSDVKTYNLDEYYPMEASHPQSYRSFMEQNLFTKINILPENTHLPSEKENPADYDEDIAQAGGLDLQLLGVGHNGHIGFNEPDAQLIAHTHITDLTESTLKANSRFFGPDEIQPDKAVTMGMGTIIKAREIVCLISGKDKHPVVEALLNDNVDPACPATFMKLHPNVTIYCDREAYEG